MNKEDFSKAYVKYNKVVFAYLLKKIKNTQDAEDLTQKTFMRFFKSKFDAWDNQEYLKRYLFITAKNCYKSHVTFMITNPARDFFLIEGEQLHFKSLEKRLAYAKHYDPFTLSDLAEFDSDPESNLSNLEIVAGGYDSDTPTYQSELNLMIEKLRAIIKSMPPKQKEAMIEVYFNGLKPSAAAIKLKSNANRIYFLTHKGKEQIKKKLTHVQNLL
jgi:RNA polymerase sigma factor (sigma-70 family)